MHHIKIRREDLECSQAEGEVRLTRRSDSKVEIVVREEEDEEKKRECKSSAGDQVKVERGKKGEATRDVGDNPREEVVLAVCKDEDGKTEAVRRSLSSSSRLSSSSSGISSIEGGGGRGEKATSSSSSSSIAAVAPSSSSAALKKLQQLQERRAAFYHPTFANHLGFGRPGTGLRAKTSSTSTSGLFVQQAGSGGEEIAVVKSASVKMDREQQVEEDRTKSVKVLVSQSKSSTMESNSSSSDVATFR